MGQRAIKIDVGEPTILFVGRLVEDKRPRDALMAVEQIRNTHPKVRLVFAGDGPLRADLERYAASHGFNTAVEFLGEVLYEEMPQLYRTADLFVLPSRAEGLPRTVLEALATETPVVTSNLRQLRTIVEGVGITVPIGEVAGFAEGLDKLASAPDRRAELGDRGRELVTTKYDWNDTVAQTTVRLEELCRNNRR